MDPIAWAALAVAFVFPVLTAAWTLGKTGATRVDLEALKTDTSHEMKNIRHAMTADSDKVWATINSIKHEYARRDDVRDFGQQVGTKIDRVEGKVDDLKTQLIEVLKSAHRLA